MRAGVTVTLACLGDGGDCQRPLVVTVDPGERVIVEVDGCEAHFGAFDDEPPVVTRAFEDAVFERLDDDDRAARDAAAELAWEMGHER